MELGSERGTWLVHQQSCIYAFLKEICDFDCLKERKTPAEPETFSTRPEVHANKAKPKHTVLDATQDPLEHTPVLRLVGGLLWAFHLVPDQIFLGQWQD